MTDTTLAPLSKAAKPFMGTRDAAKEAGAVRYIDGRPCNRSHTPTAMTQLNSTSIAEVGHDGTALYVRFVGKGNAPGGLYRYAGVPATHHAALLSADSAGRYHAAQIRGKYVGERVG